MISDVAKTGIMSRSVRINNGGYSRKLIVMALSRHPPNCRWTARSLSLRICGAYYTKSGYIYIMCVHENVYKFNVSPETLV
jgi:hypothetical protein